MAELLRRMPPHNLEAEQSVLGFDADRCRGSFGGGRDFKA